MHTDSPSHKTAKTALGPQAATGDSAAHACGWFDSSYELSQGLEVTEDNDTCLLQLWAMALQLSRSIH